MLGAACTRMAAVQPAPSSPPSLAFAAWSQSGQPDKRICVLPFVNHTKSDGLAERVRESVFGRLSLKRFNDVELRELDARLKSLPQAWNALSPQQLGRALRCDALVYGEVLEASNLYLGVYAQLTLSGRIKLIDAVSNETLVNDTHATQFRAGGVPFSLLAAVPNAVLNLRNFTSEQSLRAVDDLARHLVDKIPDLPSGGGRPSFPLVAPLPIAVAPDLAEQRQRTSMETPSPQHEPYRVQVAAFSNPEEAHHVAQLLRNEGFQPTVVIAIQGERSWHRVMLGPFASRDAAREAGVRVQKRLRCSPMIVRMAAQ